MGLILNALGTFSDYWRIGKAGIRLMKDTINSGTGLSVKNAGASSFAPIKVLEINDASDHRGLFLKSDDLAGLAAGDMFYYAGDLSGNNKLLRRLAKGTALYYLRMNAGASAPEWVASANDPNSVQISSFALANITKTVTHDIPSTDYIVGVRLIISSTQPYTAGATIAIKDSDDVLTLMATTENDASVASGDYWVDLYTLIQTTGIKVTVSGNSNTNATATVLVYHTTPTILT